MGFSNLSADGSRDQLRLDAGSSIRYTYKTTPRFLNALIRFEPVWTRDKNDRNESMYSSYSNESSTGRMTRLSDFGSYQLRGVIQADGGEYLFRDIFLCAGIATQVIYQSTFKDIQAESTDWVFHDIDDSVIQKQSEENRAENVGDSKQYRFSGELAAGWGRTEVGEYAATALLLVEVLDKHGLLDDQPSYDQMTFLAAMIYDLRRRHMVDDRLRRIEALEEITSYLQSEGLISLSNIRQCYVIQDVWDYYPRNKRVFGSKVTGGIGFYYSRQSSQSGLSGSMYQIVTNEFLNSIGAVDTVSLLSDSYYNFFHPVSSEEQSYLFMRADHSRPLGAHWHFSAWGTGRYYLREETPLRPASLQTAALNGSAWVSLVSATDLEYTDNYMLEGNISLEWLVDSRTSLSVGGNWSYTSLVWSWVDQYLDYDLGELVAANQSRSESRRFLGISSSLDYRISVPTTLMLDLSLRNSRYDYSGGGSDTVESDWSYRVSIGLQHYLF